MTSCQMLNRLFEWTKVCVKAVQIWIGTILNVVKLPQSTYIPLTIIFFTINCILILFLFSFCVSLLYVWRVRNVTMVRLTRMKPVLRYTSGWDTPVLRYPSVEIPQCWDTPVVRYPSVEIPQFNDWELYLKRQFLRWENSWSLYDNWS